MNDMKHNSNTYLLKAMLLAMFVSAMVTSCYKIFKTHAPKNTLRVRMEAQMTKRRKAVIANKALRCMRHWFMLRLMMAMSS